MATGLFGRHVVSVRMSSCTLFKTRTDRLSCTYVLSTVTHEKRTRYGRGRTVPGTRYTGQHRSRPKTLRIAEARRARYVATFDDEFFFRAKTTRATK